eukprot:gb/GECG01009622.1/.p1 GENE.gb/GECG01009622.1/~~gb/GECG01009622.1/.p1  ORF type:complete len:154 (+),score=12.53 gb/GECG01009622.1/:1-462(+)
MVDLYSEQGQEKGFLLNDFGKPGDGQTQNDWRDFRITVHRPMMVIGMRAILQKVLISHNSAPFWSLMTSLESSRCVGGSTTKTGRRESVMFAYPADLIPVNASFIVQGGIDDAKLFKLSSWTSQLCSVTILQSKHGSQSMGSPSCWIRCFLMP